MTLIQSFCCQLSALIFCNSLFIDFSLPNTLLVEISWYRWDIILFLSLFVVFISLGSYGLGMSLRDKQRKKLEKLVAKRTEELERANAELQHRNDELDRFVYSASHDLSAPLKSILGVIHIARLEEPQSSQQKYLELIEKNITKLEDFIEEIIQYSKNARMPIRMEKIHFKKIVSDMLIDYQYTPGFDKIKVCISASDEDVFISDTMRIKIILDNLISNAIKFQRVNDDVTPEIMISFEADEQSNFIVVNDNGQGIPEEYLSKVFEMFFRASEKVPGSGLGLYILKETVTRLNGSVHVKSEVNKGTTFTVTLPKI